MRWGIEGRCLDFSQWAEGRFRFCFIYLFINYMLNQSQRTMSQLDLHCFSSCAVVLRPLSNRRLYPHKAG